MASGARQQTTASPPSSGSGGHLDAKRLGTGAGAILGGLVGGRLFRLLTRVAIGRFLGAASLGVFDLAWTVSYLLAFVAPLGLHTAVIRFGATLWRLDPGAFRQLVRRCLGITLLLGSLGGAALFVLAGPLSREVFGQPEVAAAFRIMAFVVPLSAGLEVLTGATRATQSMRQTVYFRDLLGPVVQFGLFALFLALGYGVGAALWAVLGGFAVAFAGAAMGVKRMLGPAAPALEPPPELRQVFAYSLPVAFASIIGTFLLMIDRLIVGALRPPGELGVYSAVSQVGMLSAMIVSAFTTTLIPRFSDLHDQGETRRLSELLKVSTRWGLYLVLPVAVVFVLAPETTLVGLFGGEFAWGAPVLLVLMLGQLANLASGPAGVALMTGGHEPRWLALNVAALVVNVGLDLLLIPRYGILGAAWGSAIALALRHGGAMISTYRIFGIWPYDRRSSKLVVMVLASAGGVLLVQQWVPLPPFWLLVVSLLVSGGSMLAVLLAIGVEPEDRAALTALAERAGLRHGR